MGLVPTPPATPRLALPPTPQAQAAAALKRALATYARTQGVTSEQALLKLAQANRLYEPDTLAALGAPRALVRGLRHAQQTERRRATRRRGPRRP